MPTAKHLALATLALLAAAAALVTAPSAHEGDPKLLDLVPPYRGPGYRSGEPRVLDGSAPATIGGLFPASGMQLLSWMPLEELQGGSNANSMTGYVSPSGREYALIGAHSGTAFVEVTDPGDPQMLQHIAGPPSLWRDVRTYQQHAYMVSEGGGGIQVADLTAIDSGIVTLLTPQLSGGNESTHTVFINEASGFLYRSGGGSNGLRIYSLANPADPTLVATWSDRYTHEVTVVSYTSGPYAGREIAFSCGGFNGGFNQTGVSILDVTNKQNIFVVKHFSYPGAAYCHQAWPSEDLKYLYINDELDENGSNFTNTKVIDITNLSNPVVKAPFTNQSTAIGHNLYVKGQRIYEANYRSGLRIFDNTNALSPIEVAWFDTWPEDDDAHFSGLWNVYPYLPSGIVLGSDINKGLFVWWVGAPLLDIAVQGGAPDLVDPGGQSLAIQVQEAAPGALVPGSATLHHNLGSTWVSTPLVDLGGGQFTGDLPPLDCGQLISWYVTARSTNGVTWSAPGGAPNVLYQSSAALGQSLVFSDEMEQPGGWTSGAPGDNATGGKWMWADPLGSKAEPADDHTPLGSGCWFTQQGYTSAPAIVHDVDGGVTSLTSPALDLTGLSDPMLSYWRWYSNHLGGPADDTLVVQVSGGPGDPWVTVETVGPTGPGAQGGWNRHQFRVKDFVAVTAGVRLRFVASDTGAESLVEAAVDDLEVFDVACPPQTATVYCTTKLNSLGCAPHVAASGLPSLGSGQPFTISAGNLISGQNGLLFYALSPAAVPFQAGTLCVGSPLTRTPTQSSGGNPPPADCSGTYTFDFNAWANLGSDPTLVAGTTVFAQFWGRDVLDPTGFGSTLTDAVEFTLTP